MAQSVSQQRTAARRARRESREQRSRELIAKHRGTLPQVIDLPRPVPLSPVPGSGGGGGTMVVGVMSDAPQELKAEWLAAA